MTVIEVAAPQGCPRGLAAEMLAAGTPAQVGAALGDSMSLNVLLRLLPRVLKAGGVADIFSEDFWKHNPPTGRLPEAVLSLYASATGSASAVPALPSTAVWT